LSATTNAGAQGARPYPSSSASLDAVASSVAALSGRVTLLDAYDSVYFERGASETLAGRTDACLVPAVPAYRDTALHISMIKRCY
jgi:hypothetical protein